MKYVMVVVTILAFLQVPFAQAEDIIVGRVISVDHDSRTITMKIIDGSAKSGKPETPWAALMPPASLKAKKDKSRITVTMSRTSLPPGIHRGSVIRVWGSVEQASGKLIASKILPEERGRVPPDPTGVRRRLEMGHGMGSGKQKGKGRRHGR